MRSLLAFAVLLATAAPAAARPGDLDRTFGGDGEVRVAVGRFSEAYDVAVDGRGRVVAAGECCGYDDRGVIRLTRRGRLDRRYGRRGRTRLYRSYRTVLEVDRRGRALYVDLQETHGRAPLARVRRLTRGGDRDRRYGRGGFARFGAADVIGAARMPDGGIVVHASAPGQALVARHTLLARISAGGRVLWRTELPDLGALHPQTHAVAVTGAGVTLVAGNPQTGGERLLVARVGPDGVPLGTVETPIPAYTEDLGEPVVAAARDGGAWIAAGDDRRLLVARLTAAGAVDAATTIRSRRVPLPADAAVDRAGNLLLAGTDHSRGDARFGLARLTPEGRLDRRFGHRGVRLVNAGRSIRSYASSLALGPGGRTAVVAGAASDEAGGIREDYGTRRFAFARFRLR